MGLQNDGVYDDGGRDGGGDAGRAAASTSPELSVDCGVPRGASWP